MSHLLITGTSGAASAAASALPNRLEINDFVKNADQFSLYVQALNTIYTADQSQTASFFQIAGIHGLPYVQWDGSGGSQPLQGSYGGYCTHGSVLFPTWHRPYVALFEQVLQQTAKDIAVTYSVDQDRWVDAANNLRQPYWDWASNAVPPDEVIALQNVTIITPNGQNTSVANPLTKYTFHPVESSFYDPYDNWPTTLRHATSDQSDAQSDVSDAQSDVDALRSQMQSAQEDITSKTYNLLSRVHTWAEFSNHNPNDGGSNSNSVEAIHDGIHVVTGFDPIFFLHHANVDRMLSLWSALNPNVWITDGPAEGGTYAIGEDDTVGATTGSSSVHNAIPFVDFTHVHAGLAPFWQSQTGYWTSAQVADTQTFGYTYPDFNGLDMSNKDAVKSAIAKQVNQKYGSSNSFPSSRRKRSHAKRSRVAHALSRASYDEAPAATSGSYNDWTARIRFKKFQLSSSASVLIFLGDVPVDPSEWTTSPSYVGASHSFVRSERKNCLICIQQADKEIEGYVHLNAALARVSGLNSTDPSVVQPYLKENLHWRVRTAGGFLTNMLEQLTSLDVAVASTPMTVDVSADFPVAGTPTYFYNITSGQFGGASC
ncbi:hypothetical protein OF83DRAFT_1080307 [Amylostereum chailletii]|nr:hypothetical protein OF83DRAFT_1080307 [Amylostereum chailletii]